MNKYGLAVIFGLIITLPAIAANTGPTGNTCAHGTGVELIGMDGKTKFCKSETTMNWWSAFAWCDMAGGTLINMADCMYEGHNSGAQCPLTAGISPKAEYFWMANADDVSHGYRVYSWTGAVGTAWTDNFTTKALCKM